MFVLCFVPRKIESNFMGESNIFSVSKTPLSSDFRLSLVKLEGDLITFCMKLFRSGVNIFSFFYA